MPTVQMIANTTANVHRTTSPRMFAAVELTVYLRSAVAALLAVAAVFVASRRLAGALETPLGPFQLLVAGVLLAGLAGSLMLQRRQAGSVRASVLISLAMLGIAASLSLPGSNSVALLGFWAVIVGEELWAWRSMLLPGNQTPSPAEWAGVSPRSTTGAGCHLGRGAGGEGCLRRTTPRPRTGRRRLDRRSGAHGARG